MKRPDRALVLLKPQFLGDAVMACPLIDAACASFEKVAVSCGGLVQQVLWDRRDRVEFLAGRKISGLLPVLRTARELRREGFGFAFVVNRSFRSALAIRLAGIPTRVGHATEGRGFLLTHRVSYEADRPETESQLDLIRELGLPAFDPRPRLRVDPEEAAAVTMMAPSLQIGIQPGARYPEKQLPLSTLADVANALIADGCKITLFGGDDEVEFVPTFQAMLSKPAADLVGKLEIRHSMAALKRLKLMIGSDTGLMHLAAAVGCPTVTVFGPNPSKKWAHDYPPHRFIQADGGKIRSVDAETVLAAVRESLSKN